MALVQEGEPIVWAGQMITQKTRWEGEGENRRKIVEQFPQSADNGRTWGRRWALAIDPAGNEVSSPLTSAGAIFNPEDQSARAIARKRRDAGFFLLRQCPVALLGTGELKKEHLHPRLWQESACEAGTYSEKHPCPHARFEAKRRMQEHNLQMAQRLPKMATLEDQLAKAHENNQAQTRELVQGMASAFTEVVKTLKDEAAPVDPPPEPEAPPPKRSKDVR